MVRALRQAKKLGLRELARRAELDPGYLSRLERGLIRDAGDRQVQRVAAALHVPVDVITEETP
ncbi:helix-turn-helix domain-containing protein [Streptomyces luteocolor]|uniref:helix-turn-helix domain-containing protein n=1 Tax=Streptomyces luteocolor TaxID=285500 RepID=UPI00350E407E